jgi:hypothetical protein
MENVYTRWFQGYVLPTRWGIDKRKAHLSTEICSGLITRDLALAMLKQPYYDPKQIVSDTVAIAQWFGISGNEMSYLIQAKTKVSHKMYPNHERLFKTMSFFIERARRFSVGLE